MNPRYPLYIVSKGRWETSFTSHALHRLSVPHYVVVEEQEVAKYRRTLDSSATIIALDKQYQRDYDTCDDLGDTKSKGPGPARNFAWDHSIANGFAQHWVMDDNIRSFHRLNRNLKTPVNDGTIFACMEDFVERYENVAMSGPNYYMFAWRKDKIPPFVTNTRIYSCNLIRNDVPYRWRGRYNEDTDLSLQMLKDGWCTIQFNAFLQWKSLTQKVAGGNTDAFYKTEGTLPKSQMQVNLHPDVSKIVWKFGRWHHHVDYRSFRKNQLKRKVGVETVGVNNYGMVFQEQVDGRWVDGD